MRRLIRWLLQAYRLVLSPMLPRSCRFYPSCSAYALEAFEHYPLPRAAWLTVKRLAKCHPWHAGGYDPLPMSASCPSQQEADGSCCPHDNGYRQQRHPT